MKNSIINLETNLVGTRAFLISELNDLLNILQHHQEEFIDRKAVWEGDGYKTTLTLISPDTENE